MSALAAILLADSRSACSAPRAGEATEVIRTLEKALDQAKAGNLAAIGLVTVLRQPLAFSQTYHSENGASHTLAAGVMSLAHMIAGDLTGPAQ